MPAKDQPPWIIDQRRLLGDRISALRTQLGLTQDEAVELTGIPRTTYQRIERGVLDARLSQLLVIAQAFQVAVADLVRPPD
ncbi:helix-turn-helix domain-containing protein [Streptomyces sp. NPDC000888]